VTDSQTAIEILKTATFSHIMEFGGPTVQLCKRLLKLIDLIEDNDDARRYKEINELSTLLTNDILEEELKWHESADKSTTLVQKIREALKSTTMNLQDKLKIVAESARDKALQLSTAKQNL